MNIQHIIKVPYTTRPHMTKNDGPSYNLSPDSAYIEQKHQQLRLFGENLYGVTDQARTGNLVQRVSVYLGKHPTNHIQDLALTLEEDFAIMYNGVLSAICFCFPSSWTPKTALGKTLTEIHGPVADGDYLRQASARLAKTMTDPVLGSFKRYVWTITQVPSLSSYPAIAAHYRGEELDFNSLYFRMETQTTLPLPDGATSLFFVKINVCPLKEVWSESGNIILESINSMSNNILEYKNLIGIKEYLNNMHRWQSGPMQESAKL